MQNIGVLVFADRVVANTYCIRYSLYFRFNSWQEIVSPKNLPGQL